MMFDPEKNEQLRKKKQISTPTWVLPRTGFAEPPPLVRVELEEELEEEVEAMRRAEELQGYRVVLRCRNKPAED